MKRVLILGAYGQRNLGDEALLQAFLAQFGDAAVTVNSANPRETSRSYGVEVIGTYSGWPRLCRPRAIAGADLIVFGGGSLLKQIEGGLLAQLLYFVRLFAVLLLGKLAGRPIAMLGVGIGPLDRPLFKLLSRLAAALTDLICVRDTASRELLAAIGVRKPVYVTADPVFTLDAGAPAQPAPQRPQPLAVVVPRYSLSPAQQAALAAACDRLVERYNAKVLFVPFQTGYQPQFDDLAAIGNIRARMRHSLAASTQIAESPGEVLELIGQADLVLSARLHALIFAAIQGVASIALSYEVKVAGFMAEIDQSWACLTLDQLEAGQLPALIDRAWAARAATGADVRTKMHELRGRAAENFTRANELLARPRAKGLLGGGALLFASMTLVNVGNYLFNLVLGRWLGPAAFADLSLIVTLLLVVTLITATFQTISARFAALYAAVGDTAHVGGLRRWLGRRAWVLGGAALALFALGAPIWQQFFHTTSAWPFVILGLGLPLYFAQGVDRGILQGQTRFGMLSLGYQAEMWTRLLLAVVFVAIGWTVNGAVAGVAISLIATWLVGHLALRRLSRPDTGEAQAFATSEQQSVTKFAFPVILALFGQVLINNSDILIVKHFFDAQQAGQYAALALIGRIVFFATLSIVSAMFPIVAQKQRRGEPHLHLLLLALGVVAAMSGGIIGATLLAPNLLVQLLFGSAYLSIAPLIWLYATATALYALANVAINYRLAVGGGDSSIPALLAGVVQVVGLWLFHGSLREVVLVQVFLMAALLCVLLADRRIWNSQALVSDGAPQPAIEPAQRV